MDALAAQTIPPSGAFGFLLSTAFTDPTNQGGAAILGVMNFDGAGKVRGPFTLEYGSGGSLPVETINGTFDGTYSSNSGGTGSIAIALGNGVNITLDMVIDDGADGLELVAASCSGAAGIDLSASVLSGVGVHAKPYTTLTGSYGYLFTLSPQPSAEIGVVSFDSAGNVTMSGTFVGAGPSVITGTFTGTYTVNSNATGTITLAATPTQSVQTFAFVTTNDGKSGLLLLQTNRSGNGVLFGTGHLQ